MLQSNTTRPGLTLVELVVVLIILIALAGLLVPLLGGITSTAQVTATNATMAALRNAVLQYYQDMKGIQVWNDGSSVPPGSTGVPLTLRDLQVQPYYYDSNGKPQPVPSFNPSTQRGWRGPYVASTTGSFRAMPVPPNTAVPGVSLDASFYPAAPAGYPSFPSFVSSAGFSFPSYNLLYLYGNPPPSGNPPPGGDIAFLDGWGNPIVLQWPDASTGNVLQRSTYVRLVSAGPLSLNASSKMANVIDTPLSAPMPTQAERVNDLVLFILTQDLYP